jgi:N-acyl-L-homoserine lactone synthetase
MHTLFGKARDLPPSLLSALLSYRRMTCVGEPESMLPASLDEKVDRSDPSDTIYVVAREECGKIRGTARLSPAPGTSLLNEAFPELLGSASAAPRDTIWELCHFAVGAVDPTPAISPKACARRLLAAAVTSASEQGARRLITIVPPDLERMLCGLGVHVHRAGPPALLNGRPMFACWIELDEHTAGALGLSPVERRVQAQARRIEPSLHLPGFLDGEEERS